MVYLVTYNLNGDKNYDALYSAIASIGECYRDNALDSVWFVSSGLDIDSAKDKLIASIDKNDRIFITEIKTSKYSGWMHSDTWEWILKHSI